MIIEQSRQAFLLAQRLQENYSDADDEAVLSEAEEVETSQISVTCCRFSTFLGIPTHSIILILTP